MMMRNRNLCHPDLPARWLQFAGYATVTFAKK